ncbi:MAG: hypothetical protein PHW65_04420 [Dehalococcoidales bacterium]|nr:hypothetical protein [Dehalococcoidales bacterium]
MSDHIVSDEQQGDIDRGSLTVEEMGDGKVRLIALYPCLFYRSERKGGPNYVEVGNRVRRGQVLGLGEVMKCFGPLRSPVAGEIEWMAGNETVVGDSPKVEENVVAVISTQGRATTVEPQGLPCKLPALPAPPKFPALPGPREIAVPPSPKAEESFALMARSGMLVDVRLRGESGSVEKVARSLRYRPVTDVKICSLWVGWIDWTVEVGQVVEPGQKVCSVEILGNSSNVSYKGQKPAVVVEVPHQADTPVQFGDLLVRLEIREEDG